MNYVSLISELCSIIDRQNVIIQAQAMELAQLDALAREDEIMVLRRRYAEAMWRREGGVDNVGF